MKVLINKASALLSDVTTGTRRTDTSECSDRPSFALLSGFHVDCQRKEGGQAWSDHCLHPERVLREEEALHLRRCNRAQRFHPEHDHWRVAGKHESHPGCTQTAESSRCVYTEQLSVILLCPHQTWNLVRLTMGALASSQRSSQTGEKACGTWRSHGSATSTRHWTKSETFCSETTSLGARERTARKPVLHSSCRVSPVTAESRWEICRTTSRARSRDH